MEGRAAPCFPHAGPTAEAAAPVSAHLRQLRAAPRARPAEAAARGSPSALGVSAAAIGGLAALGRKRCRRAGARRTGAVARRVKHSTEDGKFWPMPEEDRDTLRQVIIVHRHGTRFPTKPTGAGNLSWPQRAQFWESYKGHLTPVGSKCLTDTGAVLKHRYVEDGGLFKGVKNVDGRAIAVYTSNVQRTLQSAWSFLLGLVPDASIFFAFRSERVFSDALKQAVGVPIYVEDATDGDDKLFHEWKIHPDAYKKWRKANFAKSEFFNYAKDAPEYKALLDKLYEATHERKLNPAMDPLKRLTAAKDVDTQVLIDDSHNRPALPNEIGQALSDEEVQLLRNIGNEVKRCWFGDADGDFEKSYGKTAAAYLAHKIWRHLDEKANALCHQRFVQFSCHDTTMCALAAHYGIDLGEIGFGCFFAFELHDDHKGGHYVKFYYNPHPADGRESYQEIPKSKVLPLGRSAKIVGYKDLEDGATPLEEFRRHCKIENLEETFESFMKLLGRADLSPTRKELEALVDSGKISWLSFKEWQDRYDAEFRAFDKNGDGALCKAEMQAALYEWYGVTGRTTDLVFHLVDREPETDALTEEDVYLAMCALVGVRGSISGKTAGATMPLLPDQEAPNDGMDDVNAISQGDTTKLMNAANTGDLYRVNDLIARGADLNKQDEFGWTALRYAVRKKDSDIVQALIAGKADVNLGSYTGRTPLMSAVANYSPNIVQILVEAGADVNAKNRDSMTAADLAKRGGGMGSSVVRLLVATSKKEVDA